MEAGDGVRRLRLRRVCRGIKVNGEGGDNCCNLLRILCSDRWCINAFQVEDLFFLGMFFRILGPCCVGNCETGSSSEVQSG